ncbi:MAG: hypothetical protein ABI193_24620 [Minicystis sp.]
MMVLRRLWTLMAAGALLAAPLSATGCSDTPTARMAKVSAGDMPQGADWNGVYFSELYGYLHLVQDGNTITGKWQRPHKDRWGEVKGTATGDLVHFMWKEYTVGSVGPNSAKSGKGYLKYKRPAGENVDDSVVGEIGRGEDEVGEPWEAVKQRNIKADLSSIGGTGSGDIGGGDWDGDNKEKGAPEAPKSPPAP